MIAYYYILGTIILTVYGQMILKWRIVRYGALPDGLTEKLIFLFKLFLDPFIASGLIAAFLSSLCWMAAMTKFDFSQAYPLIVGGLTLFSTFLAVILLKEHMNLFKASGLLLIVAGIVIVGRS